MLNPGYQIIRLSGGITSVSAKHEVPCFRAWISSECFHSKRKSRCLVKCGTIPIQWKDSFHLRNIEAHFLEKLQNQENPERHDDTKQRNATNRFVAGSASNEEGISWNKNQRVCSLGELPTALFWKNDGCAACCHNEKFGRVLLATKLFGANVDKAIWTSTGHHSWGKSFREHLDNQ